jgi:predicted DNA-binding protein with PD1-like motif
MQAKLLSSDGDGKTYAIIFDTGDEVVSGLLDFARKNQLGGSHFTAIGALHNVAVGYFNWNKKDYKRIPINEQVEVLSLMGDIALDDKGEPKLHAHIVVGKSDGTAHGGHLMEAHVRPTLEVILVESPKHLQRRHDNETGLALIRLT